LVPTGTDRELERLAHRGLVGVVDGEQEVDPLARVSVEVDGRVMA
jgi:hypothetical protein